MNGDVTRIVHDVYKFQTIFLFFFFFSSSSSSIFCLKMAFVLVAGGLGERLGFSGIKLALPIDLASEETYLGTYCASILALQRRFGDESTTIPLAIMTSDDTHARTEALLEANNYFGMAKGQVCAFVKSICLACENHITFSHYSPTSRNLVPLFM